MHYQLQETEQENGTLFGAPSICTHVAPCFAFGSTCPDFVEGMAGLQMLGDSATSYTKVPCRGFGNSCHQVKSG